MKLWETFCLLRFCLYSNGFFSFFSPAQAVSSFSSFLGSPLLPPETFCGSFHPPEIPGISHGPTAVLLSTNCPQFFIFAPTWPSLCFVLKTIPPPSLPGLCIYFTGSQVPTHGKEEEESVTSGPIPGTYCTSFHSSPHSLI